MNILHLVQSDHLIHMLLFFLVWTTLTTVKLSSVLCPYSVQPIMDSLARAFTMKYKSIFPSPLSTRAEKVLHHQADWNSLSLSWDDSSLRLRYTFTSEVLVPLPFKSKALEIHGIMDSFLLYAWILTLKYPLAVVNPVNSL